MQRISTAPERIHAGPRRQRVRSNTRIRVPCAIAPTGIALIYLLKPEVAAMFDEAAV